MPAPTTRARAAIPTLVATVMQIETHGQGGGAQNAEHQSTLGMVIVVKSQIAPKIIATGKTASRSMFNTNLPVSP